MNTTTEEVAVPIPPGEPEWEPIPQIRAFEVWVRLKKSSKYYRQGLQDQTDSKPKPRFFKLDHFIPQPSFKLEKVDTSYTGGAYQLHFNRNSYRVADCEFFLVDPTNPKNFLRIA
jgi:hypothetical protein